MSAPPAAPPAAPPPAPALISQHTTASSFLLSALHSSTPCTLLICSARDVFRQRLSPSFAATLPTLAHLRGGQHTAVVFLPSILHVRTYLASLSSSLAHGAGELRVWGLISAHAETSEFSAQGVGRTLAALVEVGRRAGAGVVIAEEGEAWWETELSVLNASASGRLDRLGVVAGRTVGLGKVLGRWFDFEEGCEGEGVEGEGGEEQEEWEGESDGL
ncbi:hypothetical protein BZA05DRAFT_446567 [Tricharina praecox]|uniref:uncharacterized protein n=1 Tax=Tricharina praecox TaxID=43433 RepID=UPI002220262F|nr:uncharacterized protein BZA05DRAFT_446567 [Tricharina praecox]KAI5848269.1 hypothetical protein BZA05DRAFT_446567 [Tricharina praecox]